MCFLQEASLIVRGPEEEEGGLVDLTDADLSRGDLTRADLTFATLKEAKLKGAKLKGARFHSSVPVAGG